MQEIRLSKPYIQPTQLRDILEQNEKDFAIEFVCDTKWIRLERNNGRLNWYGFIQSFKIDDTVARCKQRNYIK
jgi:hypothetical protein